MAATHLESLNIDKKLDKVSKGFVVVLVEASQLTIVTKALNKVKK